MKDQKSKKIGRPEEYRKDFHPIDFMEQSKRGRQVIQIATSWGLHRDTLYDWSKKHKEFSDAFKKGRQFCESFWMDLGQSAMLGQAKLNGEKIKVDLGFYCFLAKATLGWREKDSIVQEDDIKEIEVKISKYAKPKD